MYTFQRWHIPYRMMGGLREYAKNHIEPGHFLTAVLENNLKDAVDRADDENLENLPAFVAYCWNELPINCWGSREKVQAWLKRRGENGTTATVSDG